VVVDRWEAAAGAGGGRDAAPAPWVSVAAGPGARRFNCALRGASNTGCVTRSQLLSAGFDGNAIDYRVKRGRLVIRHRGVYAVGHIPPSPCARAMAAVLACGPEAVLSHRSAGALWGLMRWPRTLEVTAPSERRVPGVHTHRSRNLTERTTHYGIPTTTAARTLLDLAKVLDAASLTRAVNDARLRHVVSVEDLAPSLTRRLISAPTTAPTRSVFEDTFLAFIDRHDLPRPQVNQRIAGYEVDMLWRPQRLVAELDGRAYHDDFERDREAARFAALLIGSRTTRG
jgi:hypothetical protein